MVQLKNLRYPHSNIVFAKIDKFTGFRVFSKTFSLVCNNTKVTLEIDVRSLAIFTLSFEDEKKKALELWISYVALKKKRIYVEGARFVPDFFHPYQNTNRRLSLSSFFLLFRSTLLSLQIKVGHV